LDPYIIVIGGAAMENPMAEIERDLFGEGTTKSRVNRILEQGAIQAARTLVELADDGSSERIRLAASQQILDRVVGPAGKEEAGDNLLEFMEGIRHLAQASNEGRK
jgi:hypothetical protein